MELDAPAAAVAAMLRLGVVEALLELSQGGVESGFAERAAGGLAAGRRGLTGVVVFVEGAAADDDEDDASGGGVEDLGLSPAEGDGALTSSTGLF